MSLIEFKDVKYSYDYDTDEEVKAIQGVSFSIDEGEFVCLIGHNGSGKSTAAKLLNGLFLPTEGSVIVNGHDTSDKKSIRQVRQTVGVVFQNPENQAVASIVEDDVAFGPENLGLKSGEIRERVDWALQTVGMGEYGRSAFARLSGGQKQRVAIAGALALKPKIMVLDESTAMLDPAGREEVLNTVKKLNKDEKMTVILITHFIDECLDADKIIALKDGQIFLSGGKEVLTKSEELTECGLDVPFSVKVANGLNDSGINIRQDILNIDELVEELCK